MDFASLSRLTTDGKPLVQSLQDFFNPSLARINPNSPFYIFLIPGVPLAIVLLYIIGEHYCYDKRRAESRYRSPLFSLLVKLHNLFLALYSLITAVVIWRMMFKIVLFSSNSPYDGLKDLFCDPESKLWNNGIGFCVTLFYLSKFYEFFDTIILISTGKKPSFLQVYHHSMAVLIASILVRTQETSSIVTVTALNSVIHTLMYSYYFLTTIGIKSSFKSALTSLQIIQFMLIIGISSIKYGMRCEGVSEAQAVALPLCQVVIGALIPLFLNFYAKTYDNDDKGKMRKKGM